MFTIGRGAFSAFDSRLIFSYSNGYLRRVIFIEIGDFIHLNHIISNQNVLYWCNNGFFDNLFKGSIGKWINFAN